jgi:hypothetical protein
MKYIIDFKNTASDTEIAAYLNENGCTPVKIYNNFLKVYLIDSENVPPTLNIVESITNDNDIIISPLGEIVPVNQFYQLPNPN